MTELICNYVPQGKKILEAPEWDAVNGDGTDWNPEDSIEEEEQGHLSNALRLNE